MQIWQLFLLLGRTVQIIEIALWKLGARHKARSTPLKSFSKVGRRVQNSSWNWPLGAEVGIMTFLLHPAPSLPLCAACKYVPIFFSAVWHDLRWHSFRNWWTNLLGSEPSIPDKGVSWLQRSYQKVCLKQSHFVLNVCYSIVTCE